MVKWHYKESEHRTPEKEKVFAYHISDKCLVIEYTKKTYQSTIKTDIPIKNWTNNL